MKNAGTYSWWKPLVTNKNGNHPENRISSHPNSMLVLLIMSISTLCSVHCIPYFHHDIGYYATPGPKSLDIGTLMPCLLVKWFVFLALSDIQFHVWRRLHEAMDQSCQQSVVQTVTGVGCVLLELIKTTSETGVCHATYHIHSFCYRAFASFLMSTLFLSWMVVYSSKIGTPPLYMVNMKLVPSTLGWLLSTPLAYMLTRLKPHWACTGYVVNLTQETLLSYGHSMKHAWIDISMQWFYHFVNSMSSCLGNINQMKDRATHY